MQQQMQQLSNLAEDFSKRWQTEVQYRQLAERALDEQQKEYVDWKNQQREKPVQCIIRLCWFVFVHIVAMMSLHSGFVCCLHSRIMESDWYWSDITCPAFHYPTSAAYSSVIVCVTCIITWSIPFKLTTVWWAVIFIVESNSIQCIHWQWKFAIPGFFGHTIDIWGTKNMCDNCVMSSDCCFCLWVFMSRSYLSNKNAQSLPSKQVCNRRTKKLCICRLLFRVVSSVVF